MYLKKVQAQSILNLPKIKWAYPSDKELLNEVKSEYWIETLFITEQWPKQHDYEQAIQDLKEVSKPQELNPKKIKGKHIWESYEDLRRTVKSFGLPKDPDSMLEAIKDGKPLPMPIVVKHLNGDMELLGGATRSGIANLANQPIVALVIDEKKANEKMADHMGDKVEKEAQEEKKQHIYKQVRDYYFNNKEKPSFVDIHDQFTAHLAEFQYRKIAKLRGYPERDWIYTNTELKEKKKMTKAKTFRSKLKAKYTVLSMTTVTIPANSYLFHGTAEKFSGKLRGGAYDKIIWFSDSPKIAQLYIPMAGMTMYLSADNISRPNKNSDVQELQRQLGIDYDYSDVEWDGQRAKSYSSPKGWKKLPTEEDIDRLMREKGFGTRKHSSDPFIIHVDDDKILKEKEAQEGRLFIAKVKEPLTLWRKAKGDGDLQDLQYHDLSGFQKAKEKGVDGVLIDDFAQSKEYGNFGHLSVGLYSTDKLEIKSIPAQYREWTYKEKGTPEYPNPPEMFLHKL